MKTVNGYNCGNYDGSSAVFFPCSFTFTPKDLAIGDITYVVGENS
jgi:hypothetical protein